MKPGGAAGDSPYQHGGKGATGVEGAHNPFQKRRGISGREKKRITRRQDCPDCRRAEDLRKGAQSGPCVSCDEASANPELPASPVIAG